MKIHLGYGIAAIGYMVGILFLSVTPEDAGASGPAASLFWNLLHIPLFAGLAFCLLLSLSDGQWYRQITWRLYGLVVLVAGGYAGFSEWSQLWVAGRFGTTGDFALNLVGIAALVLAHRVAGSQGPSS